MTAYLEDLVARVRLDTSGLQAGLASASSSMQSAGSQMSGAGQQMTQKLTLPILGAAGASIKLAADFDTTMRKVGIATGEATGPLKELALEMGAKTAFSAGEASEAMLELAKGGLTAAQIQAGALESTMTLASAGGVDLASSATYVSNAMAQFSVKASEADSVAVALAGAANASSASVESLGMGLSQVGGIAASAGMSLQETVATLSAFDAVGLKGSDAGTSLKAMLNTLIPTTDKAKNAMRDLGLITEKGGNAFLKANGDFEDMEVIAGKLQEALKGASEGQRNLALETIFGSDGMRAANALAQTGAKGLEKFGKAAEDTATTQDLANVSMQGMTGAIEKAKGSLETAAIVAGTALAPAVEKVAGWVEKAANAFSELDSDTQTTIVTVAAVVAAIGPLLWIGGTLISTLGRVAGAMGKMGGSARGAAGMAGIGLLVTSSQMAEGGLKDLTQLAGTVATAFGVAGPWGAAFAFAAAVLKDVHDSLQPASDATKEYKNDQHDLRHALNQTTGAMTKQAETSIRTAFAEQGVIEAGKLLKISQEDLIGAATGQEKSQRAVNKALNNAEAALKGMARRGELTDGTLTEMMNAMDQVETATRGTRGEFKNAQRDIKIWNDALRRAGKGANRAADETEDAGRRANEAMGKVGRTKPDKQFQGDMRSMTRQILGDVIRAGRQVTEGLERGPRSARADLSSYQSSIRSGTTTAEGLARNGGLAAGRALGQGFVSGIGEYIGDAIRQAAALATAAANAARNSGGGGGGGGGSSRTAPRTTPRTLSTAAPGTPRGFAAGTGAVSPQVRVFIGERELTDIVRVEVGGTLAPLTRMARQGAI
jgi:TP901 family phage tail tape measure protein